MQRSKATWISILSMVIFLGVSSLLARPAAAQTSQWTLQNPLGRAFTDEPLRLPVAIPNGLSADRLVVTADGEPTAGQLEVIDGRRWVWVAADVEAGGSVTYAVAAGQPASFKPMVTLQRVGDVYELSNGLTAVRVPATAAAQRGASSDGVDAPAPVQAVQLPDDEWVGRGWWSTGRTLERFEAEVIGNGPVFAKVRLHYTWSGGSTAEAGRSDGDVDASAHAVIDIALYPGQRHVTITERHAMGRGEGWSFDAAAGWDARQCQMQPHHRGPNGNAPDLAKLVTTLKAGQTRMGDVHLHLLPRWSQAFDDGWHFMAHNGESAVGAIVARAGRWTWPHNNRIACRVNAKGDKAELFCPTWKGSRYWFLTVGPFDAWRGEGAKRYVTQHGFQPLDKLIHDYVLDWPGLSGNRRGGFSGLDFYNGNINPTGWWRSYGRQTLAGAGRGGNISDLTRMQVIFDPDCYGTYWNQWSPQNPNFFTDFIKPGIGLATRLKAHPRFREFAALAEQKLREDLYHSVTLPGGAGQECPGYLHHALAQWEALAPICRKHLGFDPTKWPRFAAAKSFLLHSSQPVAPGRRRIHPGGDTHPLGPPIKGDVRRFETEELPGFGVIFRNRPGTARETYLAFKSGPNRGHYHGDQLSFHYCANARQVAIDHMCSYAPRAGQEHMHNRVAFHTDELPYANMDGYERVIAFKTSPTVDIAVGQVESDRLRITTEFPPEQWDTYLPQQRFDTPLTYRRTIVQMKGDPQDYFVIRDQYAGPELNATYNLHVLSDSVRQDGMRFDFGNLTLVCIAPDQPAPTVGRHDWSFTSYKAKDWNGESTVGLRLTSRGSAVQFVTVLYPGSKTPTIEAIPGGVRVGDDQIVFAGQLHSGDGAQPHGEARTHVTVTRNGKQVLTLDDSDIDMNRSQGEVGLFVPDAGYPFGEIPDWLIRQRTAKPDWYRPWDELAKPYPQDR